MNNSTPRAAVFCSADPSITQPTYDSSVLDGTVTPTAAALGTARSTTCDSTTRRVLSTMQCLNSSSNSAPKYSACEGAPNRYQIRIHVTPDQTPVVDQCLLE